MVGTDGGGGVSGCFLDPDDRIRQGIIRFFR